jgi:glycosyltransferase involved in cell wall biosynthesis
MLVVLPTLSPGGAEVMTLRQIGRRSPHLDDHLVTLLGTGTTNRLSAPDHITCHALHATSLARAVRPLASLIRALDPDLIVSHIIHANIVTTFARFLARSDAAVVVVEHGMPPTAESRSRASRQVTLGLMRRAYARADGIVAVSHAVGDYLRAVVPGAGPRIAVVYNPVVDEELPRLAAEATGDDWLDGGRHRVVVAVGRLTPAKRLHLVIDAFAILSRRDPNLRLVIVGEGPLRPALEAQIVRSGLEGIARLVGHQANPIAYMSRAQVLAHAAETESFGNVIVEALASGTPVACLEASGGSDETFTEAPLGWRVADQTAAALASAILQAMTGPDAGDARREHASRFSASANDLAIARVFDEARTHRRRQLAEKRR